MIIKRSVQCPLCNWYINQCMTILNPPKKGAHKKNAEILSNANTFPFTTLSIKLFIIRFSNRTLIPFILYFCSLVPMALSEFQFYFYSVPHSWKVFENNANYSFLFSLCFGAQFAGTFCIGATKIIVSLSVKLSSTV